MWQRIMPLKILFGNFWWLYGFVADAPNLSSVLFNLARRRSCFPSLGHNVYALYIERDNPWSAPVKDKEQKRDVNFDFGWSVFRIVGLKALGADIPAMGHVLSHSLILSVLTCTWSGRIILWLDCDYLWGAMLTINNPLLSWFFHTAILCGCWVTFDLTIMAENPFSFGINAIVWGGIFSSHYYPLVDRENGGDGEPSRACWLLLLSLYIPLINCKFSNIFHLFYRSSSSSSSSWNCFLDD